MIFVYFPSELPAGLEPLGSALTTVRCGGSLQDLRNLEVNGCWLPQDIRESTTGDEDNIW